MVAPKTAVVIGAGGGIGAALVAALHASAEFDVIHALSRQPPDGFGAIRTSAIDVGDEASIAAAAEQIGSPLDLVIIATGILHENSRRPEKALRDLDGDALARMFAINAIGPALALKHFAPLLVRDRRAVIAALSARVGSISDNRSGGWYAYRASKAALNMIIRSAAIELARNKPQSICVALHPGTVDTALSAPFQARVASDKLFTPERAARQLLDVLKSLDAQDSGRMFGWDGEQIDP